MYRKPFAMFLILMTFTAPVLAGSNVNNAITTNGRSFETLKIVSGSNATRKSDRQKCLDMLLPQDGADCLKKLKAKNK